MITQYIQAAMKAASYRIIEDRTYFGGIDGFPGVWANAETLEQCRNDLQEVLEERLLLQLRDNHEVPEINGIALKAKPIAT